MSTESTAQGFLLLYATIALGIVWWQAHRSSPSWQLWMLHVIARTYCSLMYRQRLWQICPLPKTGGALVIANHRSPVDPMLIFAGSPRKHEGYFLRPVEFLTAREYTEIGGFIGFVCRHMQCIPVNRDGRDMDSAKLALRRLQAGHLVGIFPEGRINTGPGLLPGNPGVAWLALKGGMPIIPAYIHGVPQSESMVRPFITPARVRLTFGAPVDLSEFNEQRMTPELLNRVTAILMKRLAETGESGRPQLRLEEGAEGEPGRASA